MAYGTRLAAGHAIRKKSEPAAYSVPRPAPIQRNGFEDWGLARSGVDHERVDFAEYDIDAAGNARHDSAGGHGHEAGHQRVLDEILAATIFPNLQIYCKLN